MDVLHQILKILNSIVNLWILCYFLSFSFKFIKCKLGYDKPNKYSVGDVVQLKFCRKIKGNKMRYSISYTLEIVNEHFSEKNFWEDIESHESLYYAVGYSGKGVESCKWYECEDDMVEISKSYPELIFKIHGEGEENTDIWDAYFKNGKKQVHKAVITIAPLNENDWV